MKNENDSEIMHNNLPFCVSISCHIHLPYCLCSDPSPCKLITWQNYVFSLKSDFINGGYWLETGRQECHVITLAVWG